jgi:hypothetical protein
VTESARLGFGDSGYVDYFLRGSLFAVFGVYIAIFGTFRQFIPSRPIAHFLFGSLLLFDLGFSALPSWRLQLVLIPYLLALRALLLSPPKHPPHLKDATPS